MGCCTHAPTLRIRAAASTPAKVRVTRESLREMFGLYRYLQPYRGQVVGRPRHAHRLQRTRDLLSGPGHKIDRQHDSSPGVSTRLAHGRNSFRPGGHVLLSVAAFQYRRGIGLSDLRKALFGHLIQMPMTFFGQQQVGELTSRMFADLTQLQDAFIMAIPQFLRQSVIMVGSMAMMIYISPRLTGVMLVCFPPTIVGAILIGRMVGSRSRLTQDELAQSANVVTEAFQGIANVKAFCNELFEQNRYASRLVVYLQSVRHGARARAMLVAFIIFAIFTAIAVVLWYGTNLLIDGKLSRGELFGFALYTVFVGGSIGSFADLYSNLQRSIGATQRVRELLGEPIEDFASREMIPAQARFRGEVEFDHVLFAYPSRPEATVLRDLTLRADAGKVLALVGPSGSGKTTIASLLLRFYDPQGGQILFDGRPAMSYGLGELRGQMALVPQEVLLFGGSIAENIAYGRPGASQTEIEAAAQRANAHDFIRQFPEGYQTLVGERGIKVSGGQRQRIAIARALLKDPSILILDEATSALDAESELLVQQALDELMKGRTCFVIAHRLSTIRSADAIIMLRDGAVREAGSHDELMQIPDGAYRRMVELQRGANVLTEEVEIAAM